MKTTIEISNVLFREAKKAALVRKISLKALFESALLGFLKGTSLQSKKKSFKMKKCIFKGKGMAPGLEGNWPEIRSLIYEGHGG